MCAQLLKTGGHDFGHRLWLCLAIEAFLRGGNTHYQMLVARSGVIEHLVGAICGQQNNMGREVGLATTEFDVLAEILRFNPVVRGGGDA